MASLRSVTNQEWDLITMLDRWRAVRSASHACDFRSVAGRWDPHVTSGNGKSIFDKVRNLKIRSASEPATRRFVEVELNVNDHATATDNVSLGI